VAPLVGAAAIGTFASPTLAFGTPVVTLKAKILKIPGFPGTGNCLGCGASLEATFAISGTEYAGGPPPVTRVNFYFPKGTKIDTRGFPTCSASALERGGSAGCTRRSRAGRGESQGFVSLGGERVRETVAVQPFFATGGGLNFWIEGNTPVKIEKVAQGHWTTAAAPYGPELVTEVPLIESLPGAPDASATTIRVVSGGAIRKGRKTTYYGKIPQTCPRGGFPGKAEVSFLNAGTVTVSTRVPCPPKRGRHTHHGNGRHRR
jgi:hypothetical protein